MSKFLCTLLLFGVSFAFAQTPVIDSLKLRLRQEKAADTLRVIDLNELSWQYLDYSSDSADRYIREALHLSEQLGYMNGIIEAKNVQGILYRYANEPEKAIALYEEIIPLRQAQGRPDKLTGAYSNLGSVYFETGDHTRALNYYLKAYENARTYKQTENQLIMLNNIGSAYKEAGLNDLAIETFKKGLELNKNLKDQYQGAQLYLNLATVYNQRGLYHESTKYYRYAYEIFKKTENVRMLGIVLYNLSISLRQIKDFKGTEKVLHEMDEVSASLKENEFDAGLAQTRANYYSEINRNTEALKEIDRSLALTDSSIELNNYGVRLLAKADICRSLHDYSKAMLYCDQGIAVVKRTGDATSQARGYHTKSEIYQDLGDFKASLLYYQKAGNILDSINSEAFDTKMATLNSLNDLDKKESELQLSIHERESIEAKHKQQTAVLIGSIVVGILVLILLIFSARAYRVKKKDNELLNSQKLEIEHQKSLVEEKQKEILDSIHYAQRIQKTLLANHALISLHLPENFILFKPKDIVSGDFYWATETERCFYLAVCDSTGHGVPGAFMSLLNISFLNEAINEKNIVAPHAVLNHVRHKLIDSVSQAGAQDGMDGILLCFDKLDGSISYAAAHNRPLLVRGHEIIEYPADKMPVGKGESNDSFTLHTITPLKGDLLYLYSDGYADQFGGPKGKKFKYKPLQDELLANAQLPMHEQANRLNAAFEAWRGNLEQVDDVVVVGIRL